MTPEQQVIEFFKANPWQVVNVSKPGNWCGRYPTRELAEFAATTFDQVLDVSELLKTVYVADNLPGTF